MCQTIEQGCGKPFITKDLHPIRKLQVGCNDQSNTFIEFRAECEQRLCTIGGKGYEAQFIQDDLGELVIQIISIENQLKLILIGYLSEDVGLILLSYIQKGFKLVRIIHSIMNLKF